MSCGGCGRVVDETSCFTLFDYTLYINLHTVSSSNRIVWYREWKAVLRFDADNFLFSAAALLNDFSEVVIVAARTCKLRRPQEQIDAAVTCAVGTLWRKCDCTVVRLLLVTAQSHDGRPSVTTCRCESTQNIKFCQRPWSFVQDLRLDQIRGWWWWWWWWRRRCCTMI